MHTTITHCDLCSRVVEGPGIELPVHGMAVTLGYSRHGWGRRQNFAEFSGEVCDTCFAEYEVIAKAVALWLDKRTGCRPPTIIIKDHGVDVVVEPKEPTETSNSIAKP